MVKISQNINSNSLYITVRGTRGKCADHFFFIMVALFLYWRFLFLMAVRYWLFPVFRKSPYHFTNETDNTTLTMCLVIFSSF